MPLANAVVGASGAPSADAAPHAATYPEGVRVRRANTDDAAAISRLAARTFALACPPTTSEADIAAHIANELNEQRFRELMAQAEFHVVDAEGEVCGYIMVVQNPPPIDTAWQRPLELRRFYVDADQQGRGIADALMDTAISVAVQLGSDWIWLGTNVHNQRAIRFYRKHGFEIVGERTFTVGDSLESDHLLARPANTVGA